ncbi:MAG: polysaccharide biosynthesis/export family protein [Myxococcota bacterium]
MTTRQHRHLMLLSAFLAATTFIGCSHSGSYVWVDELPDKAAEPQVYFIRGGDELSVLVWNQERLSGRVVVRQNDGLATLPLVGDVALAGLTTQAAAAQITRALHGLVVDPKVTVSLEKGTQPTFAILGAVRNPGTYPLEDGNGVLQAIARAGGLTEFADDDEIYLLRKQPKPQRIRFDYDRLTAQDGRGTNFAMRDGDVVVVE